MSYTVQKKITPNPVPESGYANIDAWKAAHGESHGSNAGVILSKTWALHEDTKSAVLTLEYDDKDTFDRHQLRQPEGYDGKFTETIL